MGEIGKKTKQQRKAMQHLLLLLLPMAISLISVASVAGAEGDLYPIVLVPGLGCNHLEARLSADYLTTANANCWDHRDGRWFRLWMNLTTLRDPLTRCFAEQMALSYDPVLDDYFNAPGIETRVPSFGSTEGFLYKDPDNPEETKYMVTLVRRLEKMGYKEGKNLFGAPYDFRHGLAPEGHPSQVGSQFLQDLKELVEEASISNGGKPVLVLTHSFGGLLALNLLNRNSLMWRRNFVKHLIALSAPWGGTIIEMEVFASGSTLELPTVDPLVTRSETRSMESNMWLLPSPRFFGHTPIVVAATRNYSAIDMPEFLADIGIPDRVHPYKSRILPLLERLDPPGVPVTCIVGMGIKTNEILVYKGGFDTLTDVVHGDGDGLVNLNSLLALEKEWADVPEQPLIVIRIPNVSHGDIILDDLALMTVMEEISYVNSLGLNSIAWQ